MTPRLKSISITNFRSIRGSVHIQLDAPVVLIHGQNGAGKTSILSAIELGLTGQVPSLARLDQGYGSHLLHKEAENKGEEGYVTISAEDIGDSSGSSEIIIRRNDTSGSALLPGDLARFYSERCYLAQATLGRLLEIYQHKAHKSDSPLTKFVKDLLGLDHLDALIEGLHKAGDVRRLRVSLPAYHEVHDGIPKIENEINRQEAELAQLNSEISQVENRLRQRFSTLGVKATNETLLAEMTRLLKSESEEPELQRLARLRRDIMAVRQEWMSVQSGVTAQERQTSEASLTAANEALKKWRSTTGRELEEIFSRLSTFFADLPSPSLTRPEHARLAALQAVSNELERCTTLLMRDAEDTKRLGTLDQNLGRARAQLGILEEQIASYAVTTGSLAEALAEILPHIDSDNCPVCDRDFSEESDKSLHAHVSDRIATLTESAGRLQALSRERAEAVNALATADRERGVVAGRQL